MTPQFLQRRAFRDIMPRHSGHLGRGSDATAARSQPSGPSNPPAIAPANACPLMFPMSAPIVADIRIAEHRGQTNQTGRSVSFTDEQPLSMERRTSSETRLNADTGQHSEATVLESAAVATSSKHGSRCSIAGCLLACMTLNGKHGTFRKRCVTCHSI